MPEGMGYPKGKDILGKVSQGDLGADVAKRPNDKLNMNPNQKVKQGDLGSESGSVGDLPKPADFLIKYSYFSHRFDGHIKVL